MQDSLLFTPVDLPDYKFFCFEGEPKFCQVITGRNKDMCIDFFDKDWNHQPFMEPKNYHFAKHDISKPVNYEMMWDLARELSKNIPFVRVDFYNIQGRILFGELTFFPTNGMGGFEPSEYDEIFGSYIKLENTFPKD